MNSLKKFALAFGLSIAALAAKGQAYFLATIPAPISGAVDDVE